MIVGLIGAAGVVYAILDKARTEKRARRVDAAGVSGRLEQNIFDATESSYMVEGFYVVVRNDGPLPVTITDVRLGAGPRVNEDGELNALVGPNWPRKVNVPVHMLEKRHLVSGEEVRFRLKTFDWNNEDTGMERVVEVAFTAQSGREWIRCGRELEPAPRYDRGSWRARRHRWFDRRAVHRGCIFRLRRWSARHIQIHTNKNRPRYHRARLARAHDWLWGWKAGVERDPFPADVPRSWRYKELLLTDEQARQRAERPWRAR